MSDLSDHPFSPENVARESGAYDRSEAAWLRFAAVVERGLGHDLDGCDPNFCDGEGYSLDEAFYEFSRGTTAEHYVADVKGRDRYKGRRA